MRSGCEPCRRRAAARGGRMFRGDRRGGVDPLRPSRLRAVTRCRFHRPARRFARTFAGHGEFLPFFFGNANRNFDIEIARPIRWHGLRLNHEQLVTAVTVVVCVILVQMVLHASPLGRAMRATADNPSLAAVRGIERNTIARITWAISGALLALAGGSLASTAPSIRCSAGAISFRCSPRRFSAGWQPDWSGRRCARNRSCRGALDADSSDQLPPDCQLRDHPSFTPVRTQGLFGGKGSE